MKRFIPPMTSYEGEFLIFVLDVDSIIIVCYLKNWAVVVPLLEEQSLLTLEMSIS